MALAALCTTILATPGAAAEEKLSKQQDAYGYVFTDDVLKAGNPSADGGVLTVLKLGRRDRLLRPRVHFIPEMLKSVETM